MIIEKKTGEGENAVTHKIHLYDTAEMLPIKRFQKFNKYLMIDMEVGSTFEDYMKRQGRLFELVSKEMYAEAKIELQNMIQATFNIYNSYSPKERAFAIMVRKIDDQEFIDYSSTTLDEILERLNSIGFTKEDMNRAVSDVKKKSTLN